MERREWVAFKRWTRHDHWHFPTFARGLFFYELDFGKFSLMLRHKKAGGG